MCAFQFLWAVYKKSSSANWDQRTCTTIMRISITKKVNFHWNAILTKFQFFDLQLVPPVDKANPFYSREVVIFVKHSVFQDGKRGRQKSLHWSLRRSSRHHLQQLKNWHNRIVAMHVLQGLINCNIFLTQWPIVLLTFADIPLSLFSCFKSWSSALFFSISIIVSGIPVGCSWSVYNEAECVWSL